MATSNVHKTLTDAGYIVIGLGVMTFQQAQARAHDAPGPGRAGGRVRAEPHPRRPDQGRSRSRREARDRAEAQVRSTGLPWRTTSRTELKTRVEPVVGQVQSQLGELPERVVQAMEPVAARVRELAGSTAA